MFETEDDIRLSHSSKASMNNGGALAAGGLRTPLMPRGRSRAWGGLAFEGAGMRPGHSGLVHDTLHKSFRPMSRARS